MRDDTTMTAWHEWQESPWGRLRYTLAETNLAKHLDGLDDGPLRILDLGGGDGADTVRLAERGHHVTIVDNAPEMLAAATRRAVGADVTERVTLIEADVTELPHDIADGRYDLVLCHNLLQYLDDTAAALARAVTALRPGGVLSVMAVNRHATPLNIAVRQADPTAALAALDTDRTRTVTFDTTMTLHTAEELGEILDRLGCPVTGHYGIRTICDYITDDERKHDPAFFADLERLELALTGRHPYMHTARLFQLIGRKHPG
ncbi:methyltransferase domain-containing protein [Pseudonocardia acaciae]|uniref:methyltransferase domain-containing protein n=1 Tax=Pseudonocardia acaciae TaxID=551276 RepID=UPI00048AA318|nr:methyltransferase domain-containing protein [Pseudonocardia acaciae]